MALTLQQWPVQVIQQENGNYVAVALSGNGFPLFSMWVEGPNAIGVIGRFLEKYGAILIMLRTVFVFSVTHKPATTLFEVGGQVGCEVMLGMSNEVNCRNLTLTEDAKKEMLKRALNESVKALDLLVNEHDGTFEVDFAAARAIGQNIMTEMFPL